MSLLSSLPAPKRTGPKPSRWDDDDGPSVPRELNQGALIAQVSCNTSVMLLSMLSIPCEPPWR
jgi:hypothetical protein